MIVWLGLELLAIVVREPSSTAMLSVGGGPVSWPREQNPGGNADDACAQHVSSHCAIPPLLSQAAVRSRL